MVNAASSILCEVCERPRLATRPPVTPSHPPITPPRPPAPVLGMPGDPDSQVCFMYACVIETGEIITPNKILVVIHIGCIVGNRE